MRGASEIIEHGRTCFDMPDEIIYYNCAYMSPQAHAVGEAGQRALTRKTTPWLIQPNHFYEESDRARSLFASIIGSRRGDIALIPSVSYGVGIAATNLPLRPEQSVLVLEDQFPSNYYPWLARTKQVGARLQTVKRPEDGDWTRAILEGLDETVAIAALPNGHWTDGALIDLERIGPICRERGVPLVVDGTQSIGVFPFDVTKVRPAFLVTAGYKWLLGPYSTAFLYADPAYRDGHPLEYNWITREGSENFARLVDYTDHLVEDATRFDVGERSNFMLMPMLIAALEMINDWGVERISATLGAYNRTLGERVAALGFQTAPEHLRVPHLVGLRFAGSLPDGLASSLKKHKVHVSVRGDAIRVAPYLYNTREELDRFAEILARLL